MLTIYTDGSASNNGKENCKAGIGIYFADYDIGVAERLPGKQTNQRAELYAIYRALEIASEERPEHEVTIYTDSMYSINCMDIWIAKWKKTGYKGISNRDLVEAIDNLREKLPKVTFIWIKAHQKVKNIHQEYNAKADMLANKGQNYDLP